MSQLGFGLQALHVDMFDRSFDVDVLHLEVFLELLEGESGCEVASPFADAVLLLLFLVELGLFG
jgi:hypothetical protein